MLLIPVREHFSSAGMINAVNAPPEQPADSARAMVVMTSLLQQNDCVFPGGFVPCKQNNRAKLFEEGTYQIMMMVNDDEALRDLLQQGDPDLEQTVFSRTLQSHHPLTTISLLCIHGNRRSCYSSDR